MESDASIAHAYSTQQQSLTPMYFILDKSNDSRLSACHILPAQPGLGPLRPRSPLSPAPDTQEASGTTAESFFFLFLVVLSSSSFFYLIGVGCRACGLRPHRPSAEGLSPAEDLSLLPHQHRPQSSEACALHCALLGWQCRFSHSNCSTILLQCMPREALRW